MKLSDLKTGDLVKTKTGHAVIMSDDLWLHLYGKDDSEKMIAVNDWEPWTNGLFDAGHDIPDYSLLSVGRAAAATLDREITADTEWHPYVVTEVEIVEKVNVDA